MIASADYPCKINTHLTLNDCTVLWEAGLARVMEICVHMLQVDLVVPEVHHSLHFLQAGLLTPVWCRFTGLGPEEGKKEGQRKKHKQLHIDFCCWVVSSD